MKYKKNGGINQPEIVLKWEIISHHNTSVIVAIITRYNKLIEAPGWSLNSSVMCLSENNNNKLNFFLPKNDRTVPIEKL